MKRIRIRRPSPALVIACLALLIALGGTGYAALVLPANSVGTAQLKLNAVTSAKVKNGSLLRADFKAGQVPGGAAGPAGPAGAAGPAGPAELGPSAEDSGLEAARCRLHRPPHGYRSGALVPKYG